MSDSLVRIADHFEGILDCIPYLDVSDPQLFGTPERIARMYHEVFWGLNPDNFPRLTTFDVGEDLYGMIGTGKIFFSSFCAHHFLGFSGHAYCFYIPDKKILGLSKFTRIVEYFSARPQIQERLATQIADCIMEVTECRGCFVLLRAVHGCMQCRGVRQPNSVMVTPVIRPVDDFGNPMGPFEKVSTRNEALSLMEMDK